MRLFVAFDVPEDVRAALGELMGRLKPKFSSGARWVRPEEMHVTLKFIGHVETERLGAIQAALATVEWTGPAEMHFRGARFFPSERFPRVLACEVEASTNTAELAGKIDRALVPLGIPAEGREFAPHLTLARLKSREDTADLLRAAPEMAARDFGAARETEFHLMESFLRPSGAEYRRVETYPRAKKAAT